MKVLILAAYALSILYVHFRGRVRHKLSRQLSDHSSFLAPINCLMYLFSKVPNRPYLAPQTFPELQVLVDNWQAIRSEALHLHDAGNIKRSEQYDDIGFNSFFKSGWKRFYLKWYDEAHPSAGQLCPQTTALLRQIPSVKAAMFAELPPGSKLVRHRDPYAGSLRFHLGLFTPNDPACFIEVDGERYHWRDGEAVVFDETFIHYAENATEHNRIILFCDIERPLTQGWATAGYQSAKAKHNLQLPQDHPLAREIGEAMLQRLWNHPLFMSAALPLKVFPPLFNCYTGGGSFDFHIDNAVRDVHGGRERVRTDLSSTLFFSDPEDYDGGELVIQDTYGLQQVKLPAGDLVLYPGTSLHKVNPVTRGARYASFFWTQSLVREDSQRTLLFEMDQSIQRLTHDVPDHPSLIRLTGTYHNLLRRWSEL